VHSLHAALKNLYTGPNDRQEGAIDGFLIDVIKDDRLIEIQTRNFGALQKKLNILLAQYQVQLVYPIAEVKWIVKLPANGEAPIYRRKSPRKGRYEQVFYELIRIPGLMLNPNLVLEVLLTKEEEIRRADGTGSWRRNGERIVDRRLIEINDRKFFLQPQDFLSLLPESIPDPFTNSQLAEHLHIPTNLANRMTYCLRKMNVIQVVAKQKRSFLYSR
jgi:hypothetical protein